MKTNQKNTLIYTLLIIFSAGLVSCQSKKSGFEFIQNLYEEAAPLVDEQSKLDDIVSKNSGEITLTNLYVDHEGNVLFGDDLFPKRDTTKYDPNNKEKKYYYTSFYVVPYSTIDGKIVAIWNLRASLSATTILSSVPWTKPIANVHAYVELYVPEELKPKMAEIYYPARLSEEIFVPNLTYNQGNTDTRDIIFATTEISAKVKLREIKKETVTY